MRKFVFLDTETSGFDDDPDAELVELTYATEHTDPYTLWFGVTWVPTIIDDLIGFTKRGIAGRRSTQFEIAKFLAESDGATMVAANPAFDKHFVRNAGLWKFHYRMLDIESYAMGKLDLNFVPGMKDIQERLGELGWDITQPDHTSRNDVLALREAFIILRDFF